MALLASVACNRTQDSTHDTSPGPHVASRRRHSLSPIDEEHNSTSSDAQPPRRSTRHRERQRGSRSSSKANSDCESGKQYHSHKQELCLDRNSRSRRPSRKHSLIRTAPVPTPSRKVTFRTHVLRDEEWTAQELKKIPTRNNSPVNKYQREVLSAIFYSITMYPTERWAAIIAICLKRTKAQVHHWFSNERQNVSGGQDEDLKRAKSEHKEIRDGNVVYKILPSALAHSDDWSDDVLEGIVRLLYVSAIHRGT